VLSYVQIYRAVLRIPSEQRQHKGFSTYLPHLVVVSLYCSTSVFVYLKPISTFAPFLDVVMAVLYLVVHPAVNHLIYTMRNKDTKDSLWKIFEYLLLLIYKLPIVPLRLPHYLRNSQE